VKGSGELEGLESAANALRVVRAGMNTLAAGERLRFDLEDIFACNNAAALLATITASPLMAAKSVVDDVTVTSTLELSATRVGSGEAGSAGELLAVSGDVARLATEEVIGEFCLDWLFLVRRS
jgi:hypothetical protein